MNWKQKAEWLRANGYHLIIEEYGGGMEDDGESCHWMASIGGEGRRYHKTIKGAVKAVYTWVKYDMATTFKDGQWIPTHTIDPKNCQEGKYANSR